MPCIHGKDHNGNPFILTYSPDYRITDAKGREWWFEEHSYCGPSVLTKKGDPMANQPGERSPFWHAYQCWADQGRKVGDGVCVWHEPPPRKVRRCDGRNEALPSEDYDGLAERRLLIESET